MITITHTHADGTLIDGSRKGDGVYDILKGLRRQLAVLPEHPRRSGSGSHATRPRTTWKIGRAAEALRGAGHEVTVND